MANLFLFLGGGGGGGAVPRWALRATGGREDEIMATKLKPVRRQWLVGFGWTGAIIRPAACDGG